MHNLFCSAIVARVDFRKKECVECVTGRNTNIQSCILYLIVIQLLGAQKNPRRFLGRLSFLHNFPMNCYVVVVK